MIGPRWPLWQENEVGLERRLSLGLERDTNVVEALATPGARELAHKMGFLSATSTRYIQKFHCYSFIHILNHITILKGDMGFL